MVMEWISVEDELPVEGDIVWLYPLEDYQQCGWYERTDKYDDGDVHIFKSVTEGYISVTHWMPLPPPPKYNRRTGGEGDEKV
jgi:hypothetical protein